MEVAKVSFPSNPCAEKWTAPSSGLCKINTDAAVFEKMIGCAAVARDHLGEVLMASCDVKVGNVGAEVAEALAAQHGLQTAMEAGFFKVVLETDCLKLCQALQRRKCENNVFGAVIRDILSLADQCISITFSHVKRIGNRPAHMLAKLSKQYNEFRVWLEEAPSDVMSLVMADLSPP